MWFFIASVILWNSAATTQPGLRCFLAKTTPVPGRDGRPGQPSPAQHIPGLQLEKGSGNGMGMVVSWGSLSETLPSRHLEELRSSALFLMLQFAFLFLIVIPFLNFANKMCFPFWFLSSSLWQGVRLLIPSLPFPPPARLPAGRGANKAFLLDPFVSCGPAPCLQPWARYIGILALPLLLMGRQNAPKSTLVWPALYWLILPPSKLLRPTSDQAPGPHHTVPSTSRSEPCVNVFWGHQEIGYDGATS